MRRYEGGDVWGVWCENKDAHLKVATTMAEATAAGKEPLAATHFAGIGERWGLVSKRRWIFLIPMI